MTYSFHPEAHTELLAAVEYFDNLEPGLGEAFFTDVLRAIQHVLQFPMSCPVLHKQARRCRTSRFAYGVIYEVEPGNISILAVMHLRRRPDYWQRRLE